MVPAALPRALALSNCWGSTRGPAPPPSAYFAALRRPGSHLTGPPVGSGPSLAARRPDRAHRGRFERRFTQPRGHAVYFLLSRSFESGPRGAGPMKLFYIIVLVVFISQATQGEPRRSSFSSLTPAPSSPLPPGRAWSRGRLGSHRNRRKGSFSGGPPGWHPQARPWGAERRQWAVRGKGHSGRRSGPIWGRPRRPAVLS